MSAGEDQIRAGSAYVERLALEWAPGDPVESWALGYDGKALSPTELRDVIEDYLADHNPFPDGTEVETRGVDADEHLEHAVIIDRPHWDEWTVEFEDGAQAWRDYPELRPLQRDEPGAG